MDEKSVSFQMFLNLKFLQTMSEQYLEVCFAFFVWGEHAQKPKFGDSCFLSEKKNFIRHFTWFNFSHLLLGFILKYYSILHVVKR